MRRLFLFIVLTTPIFANAQYTETMSSDRLGNTISPNTVGKKVVQFQFGHTYFDYSKSWSQNDYNPRTNNFDVDRHGNKINLNTRIGVGEKTELSLDLSYGQQSLIQKLWKNPDQSDLLIQDRDETGYSLGLGIKQNLIYNADAGFSLGVAGKLRMGDSFMSDNDLWAVITVAASKALTDKLTLTGNVGSALFEPNIFIRAKADYRFNEKWGAFGEYNVSFKDNVKNYNDETIRMSHSNINGGITYNISPNFMLDLSGGYMISEQSKSSDYGKDDYTLKIGFTSRLDWRK